MKEVIVDISEKTVEKFFDLLCRNMGIRYSNDNKNEKIRKIHRIMELFGFEDPERCLDFLTRTPLTKKHIMTLAKEISVGETYFFRNEIAFNALRVNVLPAILREKEKRGERVLKIWSAGCCTGEEPYSVAIILKELIPDIHEWSILLLGTDINMDFLKRAEKGCYGEWSFRGTPADVKTKYFTPLSNGRQYQLHKDIINMATYAYLNLIDSDYPSAANGTFGMDLILCNHVLIYFSPEHIARVIQRFVESLNDSGWLMVSDIEAPFVDHPHLVQKRMQGSQFFVKGKKDLKKAPPPRTKTLPMTNYQIKVPSRKAPVKGKAQSPNVPDNKFAEALSLYKDRKYNEAIKILQAELNKNPRTTDEILVITLLVKAYANTGMLLDAMKWCRTGLSIDSVRTELYYLLSVILQELDQNSEAIEALSHTLFLDNSYVIAHFSLGILLLQNQEEKKAKRHFRNAQELLELYKDDDIIAGTDDITALRLKKMIEAVSS